MRPLGTGMFSWRQLCLLLLGCLLWVGGTWARVQESLRVQRSRGSPSWASTWFVIFHPEPHFHFLCEQKTQTPRLFFYSLRTSLDLRNPIFFFVFLREPELREVGGFAQGPMAIQWQAWAWSRSVCPHFLSPSGHSVPRHTMCHIFLFFFFRVWPRGILTFWAWGWGPWNVTVSILRESQFPLSLVLANSKVN